MRPRVFIGSSSEALKICHAIQHELEQDFDVTVWDQDVFRLTRGALDSLLTALDASDAGVFVLRPDDSTESRGSVQPTVRDNVLFELGLFLGRLGPERTFMLTPKNSPVHLPTDLLGLTSAHYDPIRFDRGEERPAIAPACRQIRRALRERQPRLTPPPAAQVRLERAMKRLSRDLEELLSAQPADGSVVSNPEPPLLAEFTFRRMTVRLELGRIQDYVSSDAQSVIGLPANEYFDDECINDPHSSLGAFVRHHFGGRHDEFIRAVRAELTGLPSQRVHRAGQRIGESYGVGEALYLRGLAPELRTILVAATTERSSVGLRAEPHFLYAALESVLATMNECRLNSLTIPVLGSGHGGMPLPIAILFNLLALRSLAGEDDTGRHVRRVRIVAFEPAAEALDWDTMRHVLAYFA
ncbi:TIR domain-containing protein [Cryptosporangium minutisporangium]|uniref:CD-NTase-associated protein 12/Pycsar effector protein TIR domain-containing protein n=1 Tax=Cryptosporangium minutisporangium TaxID=113569 RepID=A0ABP6SUU6_9ACTN